MDVSPKVVDPRRRIWDKPIFDESLGLYNRTRTIVTISGCGRCSRMKVKPLVVSGGHTGTNPDPPSLETSTATAAGHALKQIDNDCLEHFTLRR